LRELFGASIPEPTFLQRTDWANDPFTRGAYSYIHRSQLPEDQAALAAPVAGRVLFAGEATSAERFGYADGAMSTGIREAKRLLGVEAVRLAPLSTGSRRQLFVSGTGPRPRTSSGSLRESLRVPRR